MEFSGDVSGLAQTIREAAHALGFSAVGISQGKTEHAAERLRDWLAAGRHGEMDYMARHAELRIHPEQLQPGTISVISVALDYLPPQPEQRPADHAIISRYAQGRDYHKLMRSRLQKLADQITKHIGPFGYRVFSDSAPVMEVEFASQAGLGWRGKHSLLLSRTGSWRFLGEIYTDLPLPADAAQNEHCGRCEACLHACPTQAIIAPYQVDARQCISYLTIEHPGPIPLPLRPLIGTRIYGCDDCQTCCPWNRFAQIGDPAFAPRHGLDAASLTGLWAWTEADFETRLAGNPISRIGFERWQRNLAVASGNTPAMPALIEQLRTIRPTTTPLVQEHIDWALARLTAPPP